ncbi:MAG: heparinase II/III family protein [Candidatus Synoicihabitans palmerolidicus]|nr:heparinase II/III family protein [Candidatus Synoicihabitans palmerolidicus]
MFLYYGQLTNSHTQAEALNYTVYHEATPLTRDPGTVGYGSPLHKNYFVRGLAQNVPLIDELGQDRSILNDPAAWEQADGSRLSPTRGQLESFADRPVRVQASQPNYRDGAMARRSLEINGAVLTDVC